MTASALAAPVAIEAQEAAPAIANHVELGKTPKNVILLIPDGMGVSDVMAYRQYINGGFKAVLDRTFFDQYVVGEMITTPDNVEEKGSTVTDSAAAGTAMATGEKTFNGAIGVDNDKSVLENISEVAKANNKAVGVVSTSEVLHATPAVFYAHRDSRKDYDGMLEDMNKMLTETGSFTVDVLLGGGTKFFEDEKLNVAKTFADNGYTYVKTKEELAAAEGDKVLGLFAEQALPYQMDITDAAMPTLNEMTKAAIEKLSKNENGFFLMIESSEVDWANHANDLTGMISEIKAFDEAFQTSVNFAKENGETLVIAAADHDTSGFSISSGDNQQFIIDPVLGMKVTPQLLATLVLESKDVEGTLAANVDWKFTNEEISAMEDAITMAAEDAEETIMNTIIEAVNVRCNAGWSSTQHTGGEVTFYAYGPGFENFVGMIENTDVAKIVKAFMAGQPAPAKEVKIAGQAAEATGSEEAAGSEETPASEEVAASEETTAAETTTETTTEATTTTVA